MNSYNNSIDEAAKKAEKENSDGLKKIADRQNEQDKKGDVLTKVSTKIEIEKEKSLKEGAKYFYGFSSNILKLDLTVTEFKIIIHLLETLKWGNVVSITQKSIATKTEISPSVINRNWKSLIAKKVLILDDGGSIYLNTNFFFVGLYSAMDSQRKRDFETASVFDENIDHMHNSFGNFVE